MFFFDPASCGVTLKKEFNFVFFVLGEGQRPARNALACEAGGEVRGACPSEALAQAGIPFTLNPLL